MTSTPDSRPGGVLSRRATVIGALGVAAAATAATPAFAESTDSRSAREADLAAIRAVVDGIDDAVDDKDWVRCRRYFTDQVNVDFQSLEGGPPARIGADDLVGAWQRNLYAEKTSFHSRTNHEFSINGARATVRSKGYAFNRLTRVLGDDLWEVWAYYRHELVRDSSGWRCSGIAVVTVLNARGNELVRTYVPPE